MYWNSLNFIFQFTQDVVHNPKNKNIFIWIGNMKQDVNNGTAYANASKGWNAKPLNGVISLEKWCILCNFIYNQGYVCSHLCTQ